MLSYIYYTIYLYLKTKKDIQLWLFFVYFNLNVNQKALLFVVHLILSVHCSDFNILFVFDFDNSIINNYTLNNSVQVMEIENLSTTNFNVNYSSNNSNMSYSFLSSDMSYSLISSNMEIENNSTFSENNDVYNEVLRLFSELDIRSQTEINSRRLLDINTLGEPQAVRDLGDIPREIFIRS